MSVVANVAINIDGKQAKDLLAAIKKEVDGLNGKFEELEKPTKGFGAKIKEAFGGVVGQFAAITGAAVTLQQAFTTLSDQSSAEAALRSLGVNADVASQRFLQLSNDLSGQASAVELTAAAYDVASAGFLNVAEQTQILEAATKGAVGGMSDLNTVGNAVTSVLNAYGMSASQAGKLVDGFIQTQNDGKIILAEYATQIGRLAPTASAAGVGIDELNAAISTITAQGVPVEATFTGLNQALVSILKPTGEAEKLAKSLGIEFNETGLRTKGFGGLLEEVAQKTGGSTTKLTQLFGSVDALKAVLPLINDGLVGFNKNLENQRNSTGKAQKAFDDMRNTITGALKEIDSALKNLVVAFKPITPAIIAPFSVLAKAINLVADNIKAFAQTAAFLAAFVGVMKASAIATKVWASATAGLAAAKKAAGVAAAFLQGVMNPASLATTALALGVATAAAVTLGNAMGEAGVKAEEAKGEQGSIADETKRINSEIDQQLQKLDQVPPKQLAQAAAAEEALKKMREQTAIIDQQIASLDRGASITAARYSAEKAINDLRGKELEYQYSLAKTEGERRQIAIKMFKQKVDAAEIEYRQTLENIELERTKLELQLKAAQSKRDEIEAEGKLQILKAGSTEEELKKKQALDEALQSQDRVIAGAGEMIRTQEEIGKYQKIAADAQLENKKLTAEIELQQKLVSKEIGMSDRAARDLARSVSGGVREASYFARAMSQAAAQTERAANAMQRLRSLRAAGGGGGINIPQFAKGGVVDRPTLAIVGEGGEREYIVPESKAASFAANYLAGDRGAAAVPQSIGTPSINITTGPVMQQDGQRYVTMGDMEAAMQAVVNAVLGNGRTTGGRRFAGVN